jgi:hypothetical protein
MTPYSYTGYLPGYALHLIYKVPIGPNKDSHGSTVTPGGSSLIVRSLFGYDYSDL